MVHKSNLGNWILRNIGNSGCKHLTVCQFQHWFNIVTVWMTCHKWNRQMASLLCGYFHESSNDCCGWMSFHIWNRQMAFLLCGSSHDIFNVPLSVNDFLLWVELDDIHLHFPHVKGHLINNTHWHVIKERIGPKRKRGIGPKVSLLSF